MDRCPPREGLFGIRIEPWCRAIRWSPLIGGRGVTAMKWVLNTYQTAQDWDVDEMIAMCQKTGYQGIEFLQDFKQKHGWEWDTDRAHAAAIQKKMADAGLEIASLTSCQRFDSREEAQRRTSVDRVKRVIEMAREAGCSQVRVLGDRLPE